VAATAYAKFRAVEAPVAGNVADAFPFIEGARVPYAQSSVPAASVDYDELLGLARRRRSVRWFLPQVPDRAAIDRAIDVAAMAPTACNRQPYRYVVLDQPDLVVKAAKLAGGTTGYAEQVPALIVVLGNLGAYFHERDRHLIYIDASLSAMSLLFALETQGLSSCVINWSDVPQREAGMRKLLGLSHRERPIMLIAVGHADATGQLPYSSKKELDMLRSFNLADH
jgi:nitroreductase